MLLRGKVAIITGSSAGIGAGIAECFARAGALVSITGRDAKKLEAVAATCKGYGDSNVLQTTGDIMQEDVRQKLVQQTKKTFGKIDILVNNAGTAQVLPLTAVTEQHYSDLMDLNLKIPIFLTALTAPHLLDSKGCVINISSGASQTSGPGIGIYSITKAALDKYTKVLAQEMGPLGVRVNSLSPGFVPSDIATRGNIPKETYEAHAQAVIKATPLGRSGTPHEMGTAAVFLASDMASYVNGDILNVDGGVRLTPGF